MTTARSEPQSEDVSGNYRAAMDTRTISRDDFTPGQETTLTIARVSREEVHDLTLPSAEVKRRERAGESTRVKKLALHFRGTDRFLVINKTNGQQLARMFGGAVEGWIGQRVTLYRVEQVFFGQPGAVRLKAAPAAQATEATT